VVPPGGECEIKVTLKPKGGQKQIEKAVVVVTNDPEQSRFSLTMKARLLIDMEAQPASVAIPNLAPGEPGVNTFSLTRAEGSTATVKSVRVESPEQFSIREVPAQSGALATYEVRFNGGKVGTTSTRVIVETTGEHTPRLTIGVRATAAYNLVYPKRITFKPDGDGALAQTLWISTRRGDPPKIGKVEDPDGLLDVEILPAQATAVNLKLRVRAPDQAKLDGAKHPLWVHTNDRDEPKIAIEYVLAPAPAKARPRGE
jgi:hypothetical protein